MGMPIPMEASIFIYPDASEVNYILKYMFMSGNALGIWSDSLPISEQMFEKCIALGTCGGGCTFDGEMFL